MFSSILIGLALGSVISVVNHYLVILALKKITRLTPRQGHNVIMSRYLIRFVINAIALLLVHKDVPMLLATVAGILMVRNITILSLWVEAFRKERI